MIVSNNLKKLESGIFMELENRRRNIEKQGVKTINFSVGTPDLPPAKHVIDAMVEACKQPENYRYAIKDMDEMKDAVIEWYSRRFNVILTSEEILGLIGSQDGLGHVALALLNIGDKVIIPDPYYPVFESGPMIAGAEVVKIPLLLENHYLMDLDAIDPSVAHDTKYMIVSYPSNPVAAIAPPEFYEKLVWFAKKYNIFVLHDNAYCELVYDGKKCGSFLAYQGAKQIGMEFNSLSKSYNMPGFRTAFAVGNQEAIAHLQTLKSHIDYGLFLPAQKAAIAALRGPQDCIKDTVKTYDIRRKKMSKLFKAQGWNIPETPATMFVWAPIPDGYTSSWEFSMKLLEKTGIVVVPGNCFGKMGEGFVRLALVQNEEIIEEAARRYGEKMK
jgi:LL-diaminopimelate aminotransferase